MLPGRSARRSAISPPYAAVVTRRQGRVRSARARTVRLLTTIVSVLTAVIAVVLLAHVVFVFFAANPGNGIVRTVSSYAGTLAWQFKDLFTPKDVKIRVLVNYGLAAVVYLVVGQLLVRLLRRSG